MGPVDLDEIVLSGRELDDVLALRARMEGRGETSLEEDVRWLAGRLGVAQARVRRMVERGVKRREVGEVEAALRPGEIPRAWRMGRSGPEPEPVAGG